MDSKILWLIVAFVVVLVAYRVVAGPGADSDAATAKTKIQKGARIVDVRTAEEYTTGHYPKALNIPVQELQKRLSEVGPTNQPVVVYCASGMRSAKAKQILLKAGFQDVTNAGGLANLKAAK